MWRWPRRGSGQPIPRHLDTELDGAMIRSPERQFRPEQQVPGQSLIDGLPVGPLRRAAWINAK
jgi:hypothetical protein